jgi:hypothetical protein
MKTLKLSCTVILFLGAVLGYGQHKIAHGNQADKDGMKMHHMETEVTFNSDFLGESYQHYTNIHEAMVNADSNEAKKSANLLAKSLKKVKQGGQALIPSDALASAVDVKGQRKAFSALSNAMGKLVKGNVTAGKIYKAFCPMAMNGGAYWLSSVQEIRNTYFGEKMLGCGSFKETIQ